MIRWGYGRRFALSVRSFDIAETPPSNPRDYYHNAAAHHLFFFVKTRHNQAIGTNE
jgi:hypothetical protein